jgi:hypothetical protein
MNLTILTPDLLLESTGNGQSGPYHSGHVMWDGNAQRFKVMDNHGQSQDMYSNSVTIQAGYRLKEVVRWAEQKMFEEKQLQALCKEYPNLADAKQEFDVIYNIVKEHK